MIADNPQGGPFADPKPDPEHYVSLPATELATQQNLETAIDAAIIKALHDPSKTRYEWRLKPEEIPFESLQLHRADLLQFLNEEAVKGYRLVQMVQGPYWLFEKL